MISLIFLTILLIAIIPRHGSSEPLPDWTHWAQREGSLNGLKQAYCKASHHRITVGGETTEARVGDIVGEAKYALPIGDINGNICSMSFAQAMLDNCRMADVKISLLEDPRKEAVPDTVSKQDIQYCFLSYSFIVRSSFSSKIAADYVPECLKISMNCGAMGTLMPMITCEQPGFGMITPLDPLPSQ